MNQPLNNSFSFHDLRGRTLVITGVNRGIGRAFLPYLLEQGIRIIAVGRQREAIQTIRSELNACEDQFYFFECDLGNRQAVSRMAAEIVDSGLAIDGILHNAAVDPRHWLENTPDDLWQEVMQVNLFSAIALTKHLLPILRKSSQGRIVFTGSVISELGGACLTAYSASKGAVAAVTRSLAHELKGSGITVNCLIPGAIRVEKERNDVDDKLISWQSTPRRLEPHDLIAPLCLLLSRWGGGINGQALSIDGGILHPLASPEFQGDNL